MPEQLRLKDVEFAVNPEPRCPCVLLLDVSSSMYGARIDALNEGLLTFREQLNRDDLAKKRVEVAIVAFNSNVKVVQDFVSAENFEPPTLTTGGLTYMGSAIEEALNRIQARKKLYKDNGIDYYRPWVFMITDGEPQGESADVVERAAQRIREEEENKHIAFFAVGVESANMTRLSQIAVRTPLKLKGLNFREMFIWLSKSLEEVSYSELEKQVPLEPPTGWAEV